MILFLFGHLLLQLFISVVEVDTAHYKGGSITWKPVDPYTNASTVEIIISQSHSWTLDIFRCNQSTISNLDWYSDRRYTVVYDPWVDCTTAGACPASGFAYIQEKTYCTDFSIALQSSSGALIRSRTINRNANILVGYYSSAWAPEIQTALGVSAGVWRVITRIDLSQKYPINFSPVTGALPIIRVIEGQTAIIQIPAGDWDRTDDVRCRWALASGPAGDECGDICSNLPSATISASDCTITWNAVRRPTDISNGLLTSTYVAALMVEDFVNTASTTPMSSVPLQMLIFTYQPAAGSCSVVPNIIGDRPNRACIGVPINQTLVERIVASVYCAGDTIVEFVTISPLYMVKTNIARVAGTSDQWFITLTWQPKDEQKGPQVFCAAPIDQRGLTGPQHCVNFVVGYAPPNLMTPQLVQGTASPLGTVLSNHSLFSIQATGGVYHPNRNGTYIKIFNRANNATPAWQADCGYSPDCIYSGQTVLFNVRNASWVFGAHYYILFGSGAASGNIFCAPESEPISDTTFWNFNIWDPGYSSTTTTSTTPPTTHTVTTRAPLTTTPNASLTTTGIVMTTATYPTTTTVTTTTSSTSDTTTTPTTAAPTTTVTEMTVISPKDYEEQCKQPVAITTAATMAVTGILHLVAMFSLFTKLDKLFNPNQLAAQFAKGSSSNEFHRIENDHCRYNLVLNMTNLY